MQIFCRVMLSTHNLDSHKENLKNNLSGNRSIGNRKTLKKIVRMENACGGEGVG